jgi:parallel beta-helix repeat protein
MVEIGTILASAGGVLITSASNITVSLNNISECARWGIAVRSNGKAQSYNNTIERNWIRRTGLRTADFGGISFIDHGAGHGNTTGNRVLGNCVRESHGMRDNFHETGVVGKLFR